MNLVFYRRDYSGYIVGYQPPYDVSVKRYSWDVYGGPKELEAKINYPWGGQITSLWEMLYFLRSPVELYDARGVAVWWGFVDKLTINDGIRSYGIALDNMFNRVRATYELLTLGSATGLRADTTWYEDTISSGIYGVKEKNYSMTSYSIAAAEEDAQTRLDAAKYPIAVAELSPVLGQELTVEILCSGWWKILSWLYYDNAAVTYSSIAEQLQTMAETSAFIYDANLLADATTLAPDYRLGDELLLDEIQKLMEAGTDNQRRILATVDKSRRVRFYEQPEKPGLTSSDLGYALYIDSKNNLYNSCGGLIDPADCTVGKWAFLKNYESITGYNAVTSPSPVFIERAIYDVEAGEYQPESYGYKSPFDELQSIQR